MSLQGLNLNYLHDSNSIWSLFLGSNTWMESNPIQFLRSSGSMGMCCWRRLGMGLRHLERGTSILVVFLLWTWKCRKSFIFSSPYRSILISDFCRWQRNLIALYVRTVGRYIFVGTVFIRKREKTDCWTWVYKTAPYRLMSSTFPLSSHSSLDSVLCTFYTGQVKILSLPEWSHSIRELIQGLFPGRAQEVLHHSSTWILWQ